MMPECKIGRFEIKQERGVLALLEDGFWWMGLCGDDLISQQFAIDRARGRVLIGGLGLGYVIEQIAAKDIVSKVIVVEISSEVIELVWKHLDTKGKAEVVCDNLFDYLKETSEQFDLIYLDVHRDTSRQQYIDVVVPLRQLAEKHALTPWHVCIWEEEKMRRLYE